MTVRIKISEGKGHDMKKIIEWLASMEEMAGAIYHDAAGIFAKDYKVKRFLNHLAKDEAWHYFAMVSASDYVARNPQPALDFTLDGANRARIEAPCRENIKKIARGTLTMDSLVDSMIATEFSELNYFFLYVVNVLKEKRREFSYVASKVEHHKKLIERFIEELPNGRKYLKKIRRLPKLWNTRILIVDGNKPLRGLMSQILSLDGTVVETAHSGEAGLRKIAEQYYDLILTSDLLPGMNGIEFYNKAVLQDPLIGSRFLFLMHGTASKHNDFAKKHKIRCLTKPCPVCDVKKAMHEILCKTPRKTKSTLIRQQT